jgi:hypothetical protein
MPATARTVRLASITDLSLEQAWDWRVDLGVGGDLRRIRADARSPVCPDRSAIPGVRALRRECESLYRCSQTLGSRSATSDCRRSVRICVRARSQRGWASHTRRFSELGVVKPTGVVRANRLHMPLKCPARPASGIAGSPAIGLTRHEMAIGSCVSAALSPSAPSIGSAIVAEV